MGRVKHQPGGIGTPMMRERPLPTLAEDRAQYVGPDCPACGGKMKWREGRRGPFWGCRQFPKCSRTLPIT